jgi:hypothetical protein
MSIESIEPEVALLNASNNYTPTQTYNWEGQNRVKRDELLKLSDWTQVSDCSLSDEKKAEWLEYRQALRDITTQDTWPNYPVWPIAPSN